MGDELEMAEPNPLADDDYDDEEAVVPASPMAAAKVSSWEEFKTWEIDIKKVSRAAQPCNDAPPARSPARRVL